MAEVKLPATKPHRVLIAGASYWEPRIGVDADGNEAIVQTYATGLQGQEIELTDAEAKRLIELGAVVDAKSAPLYSEQSADELAALAKKRGITVQGSGANGNVLKEDLVAAHKTYDAGHAG